ncbi:hypothetical protein [Stenotrophomonas maltophilia]|uniref:Uncharacterized protein n=1 Tax=Stenotrophomonas maltophilia TaxID=40324 RepID=A0AAP7GV34_STEMA|nr:hypothetical protein [Stenotrophomonas maltophilia]KOQ70077.1 hypothetical protein ABW43_06850 [Stenotrophomonas maltophilia]OBU63197.1 hypothetical protein A9K56_00320 [Stenotrophomonas maltophilia]
MKADRIRMQILELLSQAEAYEGRLAYHQLGWAEWDAARNAAPPDWLIEGDDALVKPFESLAERLYLSTIRLLETEALPVYLRQFLARFGEPFNANQAATVYDIDVLGDGEPYIVFLAQLREFLAPLDVLNRSSHYLRFAGIKYLETVLNNTASIIQKSGENPTSETGVYQVVRNVLEAFFPSAISPKSNFLKTAQEYKPDILIPELSTAIEYKYAKDEAKLKATIAQISDDVKGYTGDIDYDLFYAVFYVTSDFWGKEKFDLIWKEKGFPENWRGIYVVGK